MIKIYPLFISLSLGFFCSSVQANPTQMIVDDSNRIMPIFFHEAINHPLLVRQQNLPPAVTAPTYQPPTPAMLPLTTIKPMAQRHTNPHNPLSGPYFLSPERHQIMAAAHSALGIPYLYGGNNPARGLDCSSLMKFIYKDALGISIPRTAASQRDSSRTINLHSLQPGDMLFFKINRRSNHVGIYIGNGQFIHASSSARRASVASMSLPYWQKRFVKFGSYLNS